MGRRCADPGSNGKHSFRLSDRFLAGLQDATSVSFVSHVHPDPDSLGSMMGLAHLIETCLGKPTRLTRDGLISRAENRAMVELLDINLVPIDKATWFEGAALIMVDSQPNTGRHNLDPTVPLYAVIDHHDTPGQLDGIPFVDVRNTLGATCSLVTSYLMEQDIEMPPTVATGLLYGIETETSGYPREASRWTTRRSFTSIRWPTRICWRAFATPVCRRAILKAYCGRCKAPSSTTASLSAGSTICRSQRWRRRLSIF